MFVNIIYMYSYFIPYFYANIVNKVLINNNNNPWCVCAGYVFAQKDICGAFLKVLQRAHENTVLLSVIA